MKLSVSLPDEDVAFLDTFADQAGMDSRSAVVQRAIALLRAAELVGDYETAFREWDKAGDADVWAATVGDGISGR
ncbi:MAG: ribbon-helix-helix domain-containing protein [Actinobacteria bacterium]|nr:ribbon-helix-helix domain-containing protein [Actinomycetota bacterium]